jgi:hypothetical protein
MIVEREQVLNARAVWQPSAAVRDSRAESAEIQRQVAEFLSRGGAIQKIPTGVVRYSYDMVSSKPGNGSDFSLRYKSADTMRMMTRTVRFRSQQGNTTA